MSGKKKLGLTNTEVNTIITGIGLLNNMEAPTPLAFRSARIGKILEPIVKATGEVRDKLLKKYANKDENGEPAQKKADDGQNMIYDIDPENSVALSKELDELMNEKNELEIPMLRSVAFKGIKKIQGTVFFTLWDIIEDPEELEKLFPIEEEEPKSPVPTP